MHLFWIQNSYQLQAYFWRSLRNRIAPVPFYDKNITKLVSPHIITYPSFYIYLDYDAYHRTNNVYQSVAIRGIVYYSVSSESKA